MQKRIAALHDISCFGRCSLTVALPICSAAGIETAIIPTAVLSTHTGGFKNYTFRDLTDDIIPIVDHWKSLGLHFDAFYTGYLGNKVQVDLVIRAVESLKNEKSLFVCDPAMADHGKLYAGFEPDFPRYMLRLCKKADIIVPNITEAAFLLDTPYREGPYSEDYIESLLVGLYNKTGAKVVLTGVFFDDKKLGAAVFDGTKTDYIMAEHINATFHGTGDVFSSVLTASLLNDRGLIASTQIAVNFTRDCIKKTVSEENYKNYGVNFEACIPTLIKYLQL